MSRSWASSSFGPQPLRALYNARSLMDSEYRADPANRAMFMKILKQPAGITHAFRLMNQTSVLGRYLWPFRRIVGQMQHDLFHVYTVDQHILMVLRNVRRFFIPEHAHEYPFCSQLAAGWDKPWCSTAALFHDIAKGRGGDHSELGAQEVRRFCTQHKIARQDAALIEFLVREHLTMSHVAQKEDLADPEVITKFARHLGNEHRLTALYLLTVADIRGTSPKVWNAWKGKLLEDLYKHTLHALGGRAPSAGALVEERKRAALEEIALHAMPKDAQQALWNTLDVGYPMRHDADELAWHARQLSRVLWQRAQTGAAAANEPLTVVRARISPVGEGLQVMAYSRPAGSVRPHLAATSTARASRSGRAGAHYAQRLRAGHLPDRHGDDPEHYRELIGLVEAGLPEALASDAALPAPRLGRVSRRARSFPITPRGSAPGRKSPALAAERVGQRPRGPALRHRPRAGRAPDQRGTGQDLHPGRAGGRHLPAPGRAAAAPEKPRSPSSASCWKGWK